MADKERKLEPKIRANLVSEKIDDIRDQIQKQILIQQPIINLIDASQSKTCNLADIAERWLKLEDEMPLNLPAKEKKSVRDRTEYALCDVTLAAFMFDPKKDKTLLSDWQKNRIERFVNKHLKDIVSVKAFGEYKVKGIKFADLAVEDIDARTFWLSIKFQYPLLSELALDLLNIPASSAEVERVFSKWREVHTSLRNRLGPEKSEKLLSAYYYLRSYAGDQKKTQEKIDDLDVEELQLMAEFMAAMYVD